MYNTSFEYITNLQYKVKVLASRLGAFESGEKYLVMKSEFGKRLSAKEKEINKLKIELADAHAQTVTVRKSWMQIFDDLEKEREQVLQEKGRIIISLEERALKAERLVDELKDKLTEKNKELYQVKSLLEEEEEKNKKLTSQLNRDYENSSIPSSMMPSHKKIPNSREKTGKKPGGQPGHKGHSRKKHIPTNRIHIPASPKHADSQYFKPTDKTITKQMVNLSMHLSVDEYSTPEYRNIRTGQRVHAEFPDGVVNDVNYGGSIKSVAFLLNNRYCVAIDKVREFLSEVTGGQLQISRGMINGLSKEFSKKTQAEQKKAFSDALLSPVMGTDFTVMRVNGKNVQVAVCATSESALYFAREQKGIKGVKGTPVEDYQGILVHDHDKTFYNYAGAHQECLAHVQRYLKSSMENEPALNWNKQMRELIREMIHYRNALCPDSEPDLEKIRDYEARYIAILDIAKREYEYEPPRKYFKDGYNLYVRLREFKDSHLLFLGNSRIPATNNLCERLLRILKRKQKQAMTFRSFESLEFLCDCLGTIASIRAGKQNLYTSVSAIFD